MRKKIFLVLSLFIFSISFIINVNAAAPATLVVTEDGIMNYEGSWFTGNNGEIPAWFSYKYDENDYLVLCGGSRTKNAAPGYTYNIADVWSKPVRAGIGAIIKSGVGIGSKKSSYSSNSRRLYATQIAIWKYLEETGTYTSNDLDNTIKAMKDGCKTDCYDVYENLLKKARTASNNVKNTFAISTSSSSLTFTKSGDYYVSNNIKVSGTNLNSSTVSASVTGPSGTTVTGDNSNGFVVKVPVSKLTIGSNSVSVKFQANSNESVFARQYKYGSAQSLVSVRLNKQTYSASKSISGTITTTAKLTIQKRDILDANSPLAGAKFKITKDGSLLSTNTSTTKDLVVNLSGYGKYCVTEIEAPNGYVLSNTPVCVTISATNLDGTIKIINKKNVIKFKKVTLDKQNNKYKLLPQAILKVIDSEGKEVKDLTGKTLKWTTDEKLYQVEGIKIGTYYLTEEKAPSGYVLAKPIKFVVKANGVIESDNLESKLQILDKNTLTIIMSNDLIKTHFSKIDATNSKELPGAKLQVLDKDKKTILDENGKEMYTWVSTDKPYIIEGLPVGTYYLKEIIAPTGYTKTESLVEFKVTDDGVETNVIMKNSPIIKVPNTAKTISTPMAIISVLLLGIGVGIVYYVIKNKKTI